ncbi:MAG: phosphopentomutase [Bradymonadales bacterium]|nr:phosphopentomutase [Bradymonadales bacterium]
MNKKKQGILIVLDSVGIGALPDAASFGDEGADTLGHIAGATTLVLPNLAALGLGNIDRPTPLPGIPPQGYPRGAYGRMAELSLGKDTSTGHWEMMGVITRTPFRTYPQGFPPELLEAFIQEASLSGVLGNKPASGTVIIEELGPEHCATGKPIVYTSGDPVFQIAAHEEVIPIERLYQLCEIAYRLVLPYGLSRVIARPFIGKWPSYERTYRRKDYTVPPPEPSTLVKLKERDIAVTSIGKIEAIYSGQGITSQLDAKSNIHAVEMVAQCMKEAQGDLVFANLVDFDSKYGHRRNPDGYARALEEFDRLLPGLIDLMGSEDLMIITADHGNDPTFKGTDHTREHVPLLATGSWVRPVNLGTRQSFADIGATVASFFGHPDASIFGTSFLEEIGG